MSTPPGKMMLISELSRASGFSRDTLRYYEELGIIKGVGRKGNNYREYGQQTLKILEIVHIGKDLGFSLAEIKKFTDDIFYNGLDNERVKVSLRIKLRETDRKIGELSKLRARLNLMIESLDGETLYLNPVLPDGGGESL